MKCVIRLNQTMDSMAKFMLAGLVLAYVTAECSATYYHYHHWASWGPWSHCHVDCSRLATHTYTQHRTRDCYDHGNSCEVPYHYCGSVSEHEQTRTCPTNNCGPHYTWSEWGIWSACHVDCTLLSKVSFDQTRTRTCVNHYNRNLTASTYNCGHSSDSAETRTCPNNCNDWTTWGDWTTCSSTCQEAGMSTRARHCAAGTLTCVGVPLEFRPCGTTACSKFAVVDGGWGDWGQWTSCSVSCDLGQQTRNRSCDNPAPQNGGQPCVGEDSMSRTCEMISCTVDGGWGEWQQWTSCSVSCDVGQQTRNRSCVSPAPQDGGKDCDGAVSMTQICDAGSCPVDGGWSTFITGTCSVTCGRGYAYKHRTCTNPAPSNGGKDCVGSATETVLCDSGSCDVDGGWSDWSSWTACNIICGSGHNYRFRTCSNPTPAGTGANCTGVNHERRLCHAVNCPSGIMTCHDDDLSQMTQGQADVIDATPIPPQMCSTPQSVQEMILGKMCHVTSTAASWTLGVQLHNSCESAPLYSPFAVVNKKNNSRKYGILFGCYRDIIQLVDLACRLKVQTYFLNDTIVAHHLLLM